MALTVLPVTPPSSSAAINPVNYYDLYLNGQRNFNPTTPPLLPGDEASNQSVDLLQSALDGTLNQNLDKIPQSDFIKSLEDRSREQEAQNQNNASTAIQNSRTIADLFSELAARLSNNLQNNNGVLDFSNDNTPALTPTVTEVDTTLSVENVVAAQETPEIPENPVELVNPTNSLNIYSYIVNALQGGANEANTLKDIENRTEFEV